MTDKEIEEAREKYLALRKQNQENMKQMLKEEQLEKERNAQEKIEREKVDTIIKRSSNITRVINWFLFVSISIVFLLLTIALLLQ